MKIVLIFDNAAVHVAKSVDEAIQELKCLTVTLPPYTPEWNNSEMAINIIKERLTENWNEQVSFSGSNYNQIVDRKETKKWIIHDHKGSMPRNKQSFNIKHASVLEVTNYS